MIALPTFPMWSDLHPLVIHFPIALLLVAPLFVVVGAIVRGERGRIFLTSALVLMILGTAGAWLAVATGEAAGEVADHNPPVKAVLEEHEDLAESTRGVFTVLTLLYATIVALPFITRRATLMTMTVAPLFFLLFYAAGALLLANTAHEGGRLVHELGTSSVPAAVMIHDD